MQSDLDRRKEDTEHRGDLGVAHPVHVVEQDDRPKCIGYALEVILHALAPLALIQGSVHAGCVVLAAGKIHRSLDRPVAAPGLPGMVVAAGQAGADLSARGRAAPKDPAVDEGDDGRRDDREGDQLHQTPEDLRR